MTNATMTLQDLQAKWIGKTILSSTDHDLDSSGRHPRKVTEVYYSEQYSQFVAYAEEHHRANTAEALDRRLHSLVSQSQ